MQSNFGIYTFIRTRYCTGSVQCGELDKEMQSSPPYWDGTLEILPRLSDPFKDSGDVEDISRQRWPRRKEYNKNPYGSDGN